VQTPRKPWWQQATALVSLGTGGAITGFAFAHGTPEHLASPASVPVTLTALDQAMEPGTAQAATDDTVARSAIVKVASYYAKLAQSKTPAEMEALIWQQDSADGADHGQSCAAFASMTLQLGAQLAGKQSWVTGGSTYPWPLHDWVDARVDPNSDSMNVTSILQDAEAAGRYHPAADGYLPQPGDWVLFDQHVEVVTGYSGGVLSTIGGDSLPNFSVNAHEYSGSLAADGVQGFVDNGNLPAATTTATSSGSAAKSSSSGSSSAAKRSASSAAKQQSAAGTQATSQAATQVTEAMAAIPGVSAASSASSGSSGSAGAGSARASGSSASTGASGSSGSSSASPAASVAIPGVPADLGSASSSAPAASSTGTASSGSGQATTATQPQAEPSAAIPGVPDTTGSTDSSSSSSSSSSPTQSSSSSSAYQRHQSSSSASAATPGTAAQRAFINSIAPGAVAAQRTYGVPAAVTIAQAIDESAWGQSTLASEDHNLFGIKGTGPAGSVSLPTQEVYDGQAVSTTADFRVYNDVSESIEDHGKLLADSGSYTAAMANKQSPNAFAAALTGIYATDPDYGTSLIGLMRQYNLYRYDASATTGSSAPSASGAPATKTSPKSQPHGATQSHPASKARTSTQPTAKATSPRLAPPTTAPSARATSPVTSPSPSASSTTAPTGTASAPSSPASPTASTPAAPAPAPSASSSAPASSSSWPTGTTPESSSGAGPHSTSAQGSSGSGSGNSTAGRSGTGSGNSTSTGNQGVSPSEAQIPGIPEPAGTAAGSNASASGTGGDTAAGSAHSDGASPAAQASTSAAVSSSAPVTDAVLTAVYQQAAGQQAPSGAATAPVNATAPDQSPIPHQAPAPDKTPPARKAPKRKGPTVKARKAAPRYQPEMPTAVKSVLLSSARKPLARAEFLYRDVAASVGLSWKILAACDWMQCEAHPRYSPVRGEKLGSVNPDGTVFHTKSEALTQTARDLVALADAVYEIDLTLPVALSVLELANVFAAYRWGGLLRQHHTSAMEFPYSVQGLTEQFLHMRWPKIADPNAPDKPGSRYKRPFGAVPVVLSLDYPAIVL
jgi:lysozyme